MSRRPEVSLGMGLATATIVYTIYNRGLPSHTDIRAGKPGDETLEATRKQNAWMAAATVGGISLIAKDPTVFIFGGLSVVALDWLTRVNNWTNPLTGTVMENPFSTSAPSEAPMDSADNYDYANVSAIR